MCREIQYVDWHVEVELPKQPIVGRAVVLMDEMPSPGDTIPQALRRLKAAGAPSGDVAVTHVLFADGAAPLIW